MLGALVAGCTGQGSPPAPTSSGTASSDTPSPTPAPTAAPTPTADLSVPPARPDAMATPSADGAAAAASYFISLYPYAYATGDTAEWATMSGAQCAFCTRTRDGVSRVHDGDGRVTGGAIDIHEARGTELDAGRWYSAKVIATEAPSTETDASGSRVSASEGGRYAFEVALTYASDGWTVDAVDVNPADAG
ncbi:DUF6318 family protein [Cellulomonas shaoxiangyii]|nr:DUF6318 family protein [Cellulomonas shaoxiangyii]